MIRLATVRDVPGILEIYAPYVRQTTITFEYEVPALEAFTRRFLDITRDFPWLVWEEDGVISGYAYASLPFERAAYRWCCEPSIYLAPQAQGRGIAGALYAALEALLQAMGYQVSYAIITGENSRSLAFHKRFGYTPCGKFCRSGFKFGRWLDVEWLEKRLNSVETPSNFPMSWECFSKDEQRIQNILGKMSLSKKSKV